MAGGVRSVQVCRADHGGFLSLLEVTGVGLVEQLRGGFVVLKGVLDTVPVERNSSDIVGPLHRLLLLHCLPVDLVVDGQHDDDGEPECQGGRDESVGNVGDKRTNLVARIPPFLTQDISQAEPEPQCDLPGDVVVWCTNQEISARRRWQLGTARPP